MSGEVQRDDKSGLIAINSRLGWLLNGPIRRPDSNTNMSTTMLVEACDTEEKRLSNEVHRFWDLDTVGIKENENSVLENFMETIKCIDNRYEVEMPFKTGIPILPDYYNMSVARLKSLKTRLDKDPKLLKAYDDVFKEQLKLGILEEVTDPGEVGHVVYLPHREVIREDKSTKLRVVFDASASYPGFPSLNDVLYKGPCLTPLIYDMLLRFHYLSCCCQCRHREGILANRGGGETQKFFVLFMV